MTSSWLSAPASSLSACLKDWKTSKTTLERLIRAARPCASGSRGASSAPASRRKGHRRWLAALDLLDDAAEAVEAKVVFLQSEIRTKARETKGPKTSKTSSEDRQIWCFSSPVASLSLLAQSDTRYHHLFEVF